MKKLHTLMLCLLIVASGAFVSCSDTSDTPTPPSRQHTAAVEELMDICEKFEETIALLVEDDARVICRMYYGVGMTDEAIGEKVHMDQATINRIRNKAIAALDLA